MACRPPAAAGHRVRGTAAGAAREPAEWLQGLQLRKEVRQVMVSARGAAMLRQRLQLRHHGLIASLVGEHPTAAHACRLAKRWAAAHMLSGHLPEEMTELIVAAAYSRSPPPPLRCLCIIPPCAGGLRAPAASFLVRL